MSEFVAVQDLEAVLDRKRELPSVVMWNRLEGRPRAVDFSRALRAEVRDALWMLSRQWQLGEFRGDDAGSPVLAKVCCETSRATHVRTGGGAVLAVDGGTPLEATAEMLAPPLAQGGLPVALDDRLVMGRHWTKLLVAEGHAALVPAFRTAYGFTAPDPNDEASFPITAHAAAWQSAAAVATRAVDGGALYLHLLDPTHRASDGLGLGDPLRGDIDTLGARFLAWAAARCVAPRTPQESSWRPRQLEYSLELSVPSRGGARTLVADEYHGGRLDWFNFDMAESPDAAFPETAGETATLTRTFIPTGLQFDGMPNTRWWTFEEGATNFGEIRPDTTDLGKLLLVEFGLVYANDWFLLPVQLPVGTLTRVAGLVVTNVFGERIWIESASRDERGWEGWSMFQLSTRPEALPRDGLLLLDATPAALEGRPVEAVSLVRDEASNMVWGIEGVVQLPDGSSRRGREVALELHGRHQAAAGPPPPVPAANDASIRYELMSAVAENWIPFVPVHLPGDNREIQLQRAAMPRLLEGVHGAPARIRPRTALLREGLDASTPASYYVAEEEVPRAGVQLTRAWQRARSHDGRVHTWLGVQRTVGRGEGSSGLAFDLMRPKPKD